MYAGALLAQNLISCKHSRVNCCVPSCVDEFLPGLRALEMKQCALQRDMTRSMDSQQPQVKQILTHEITLQRPENDSIEYDDYARRVAKGLRQHLSSLPNTLQNSMKVFVSGLSSSGDIQITIVGVGLRTPNMPAETIREDFYLAIHKALCVLKRESAADVQHEIEEQDAEAKALATEEMERVAMSGNKSGPGPMIA